MLGILRKILPQAKKIPEPTQTQLVGDAGEDLACALLKRKGYRILGRNLELRFTEIDILAEAPDRDTVVFVEVKTRTRREDAEVESLAAELAVDDEKRVLLVRGARHLARANQWYRRPLRIDVVAVEYSPVREKCIVRHREDIVK
jgi:putative endonuclease